MTNKLRVQSTFVKTDADVVLKESQYQSAPLSSLVIIFCPCSIASGCSSFTRIKVTSGDPMHVDSHVNNCDSPSLAVMFADGVITKDIQSKKKQYRKKLV